jgi:hypothetical protein
MLPPTVLVSSTVYGQEQLLDQVFAVLKGYGYHVWMSHKGTIPLDPHKTALENCLAAVEQASVVFGIINGRYGSGKEGDELSITHREILRAIELGKPRFLAVDRDVMTAREVLKQFRNDEKGTPRHHSYFKPNAVLQDIRVLDIYEAAVRSDLPLAERKGNWVQQYQETNDLFLFIESQFADIERLRKLIAD